LCDGWRFLVIEKVKVAFVAIDLHHFFDNDISLVSPSIFDQPQWRLHDEEQEPEDADHVANEANEHPVSVVSAYMFEKEWREQK
jgi:hypothetical protein